MLDLREMLEKILGTAIVDVGSGCSGKDRIDVLAPVAVSTAVGSARPCNRTATRMVETTRVAKGARPICLPLMAYPTPLVLVGWTIVMTEIAVPSRTTSI